MPDDAATAVAAVSRGTNGRFECGVHGPELVILGALANECRGAVHILGHEGHEVAHQVQETTLLEHTTDQYLQPGQCLRREVLRVDRLPRRKVLQSGPDRTGGRTESIADHLDGARCEEFRELTLVGAELPEGTLGGSPTLRRRFQLEHRHWDAVDEPDDVHTPAIGTSLQRELVDNDEVVVLGVVEVDVSDAYPTALATVVAVLDRAAFGDKPVDSEVFTHQVLRLRLTKS